MRCTARILCAGANRCIEKGIVGVLLDLERILGSITAAKPLVLEVLPSQADYVSRLE
jgi:hypothetical protein